MKFKKSFLIMGCFAVIGCANNNSVREDVFGRLNDTFSKEEKTQISSCNDVACIMSFVHLNQNEQLPMIFDNDSSKINIYLDSLDIKGLDILVAYNKYLNNEKYDFVSIKKEVAEYYNLESQTKDNRQILRIEKLKRIATGNFEVIKKYDTICLYFPYYLENGVYNGEYRMIKNDSELMQIKFVVNQKTFIPSPKEYNSSVPQFNIVVETIGISHTPSTFMSYDLKIGSKMSIDIFDYGRKIELCNPRIKI